jgi:hypothetical protein
VTTVCIGASNTLRYPIGGHLWVFINWACGFRSQGCKIIWLDQTERSDTPEILQNKVKTLRARLAPYGLADNIALVTPDGEPVTMAGCVSFDEAAAANLLFDLRYDFAESVIKRFRKTALLDIDPGLLQLAMQKKHMGTVPHDVYFTIGETVGQPGSRFPSLGLDWVHVPPCIATDQWPVVPAPADGAFSTVSHWYMDEWAVDDDGTVYKNDKRSAFLPFVELPTRVKTPLELAIFLNNDPAEQKMLEDHGWRVKESHQVAAEPTDFQRYLQNSRGEFGCAKPSYVKMQTSWISDRTLCYLASGRPAIIENTGPTQYFDGCDGVLRFSTFDDAVACFRKVESDYARHSAAARALVEERFAASKVVPRVLDRCL